jgi:hypothetical protein
MLAVASRLFVDTYTPVTDMYESMCMAERPPHPGNP